jgi:hypothetical protein
MENTQIHFNKALDALKEYYEISDASSKEEHKQEFFDRLSLHLLTGEFLDWFPIPLEKNIENLADESRKTKLEKAIDKFVKDNNNKIREGKKNELSEGEAFVKISTISTRSTRSARSTRSRIKQIIVLEDKRTRLNWELAFHLMNNLFVQIQADIERNETYADIDLGINDKIKTGNSLFTNNLHLLKIDMFWMSYEHIDELIEELHRINQDVYYFYKQIIDRNEKEKLHSKVIKLTLEKTNFLFRKALLSKVSAGKVLDDEADHKNLASLHDHSRFYLEFLYEDFKVCIKHGLLYSHHCPPITEEIKKKIEVKNVLGNLHEYFWAIMHYSSDKDEKGEKLTRESLEVNQQMFEKIKECFKKYRKNNKEPTFYDAKAINAIQKFIERSEFRLHLLKTTDGDWSTVRENIEKFNHFLNKEGKDDQLFPPMRNFALYCERVSHKDKWSAENVMDIWSAWNVALSEWRSKIKLSFHYNFHPYFPTRSEAMFELRKLENVPTAGLPDGYPIIYDDAKDLKIDELEPSIFIASGYILPFNKELLKSDLGANRRANARLVSIYSLKAKESIRIDAINEAKEAAIEPAKIEAEKTARATTKDSELRAIQVLTVFVTVVVFAGNAIVVEKYISSLATAFTFLGILGFALTVFVYLLLFQLRQTRSKEDKIDEIHFARLNVLGDRIAALEYKEAYKHNNNSTKDEESPIKRFWKYNKLQLFISAFVFALYCGICFYGVKWAKEDEAENKLEARKNEKAKFDSTVKANEKKQLKQIDSLQTTYKLQLNTIQKTVDSLRNKK